MRRVFVPAAIALFLAAPSASGQQADYTWFTIMSDRVDVSNMPAYDEVSREWVRLFGDKGIEDVSWVTITGPELGYTYTVAGMGPADMAEMNATWGAAMAQLGAAGTRLQARGDALVESRETYYLLLRPDLSYQPAAVGFSSEEPYRHYVQFRVHPAKTAEFEASAKAWANAYGSHGAERGFRIYQYVTGSDLPMYLLVENARDEAHHATLSAQIEKTLGADREALMRGTGATLRSVKEFGGWVRPEFSYPSLSGGN